MLEQSNKEIIDNTRHVLEIASEMDLDGADTLVVLESAFINQVAGMIVANDPGGDEDQRHQQLVYLLSDYVKCMKNKFLGDDQVKKLIDGQVLGDIILFSEKLMESELDQMVVLGNPPSKKDN